MRRQSKAERARHFYKAMEELGFKWAEIETLRRAQLTLRSWAEKECGSDSGCIERDEKTGKPYWYNAMSGKRYPAKDMEKGALARVAAVMANHPTLISYHQTDPRGCALYILPKVWQQDGQDLDAIYNRGFGVCL